MNETRHVPDVIDWNIFHENQQRYPLDQLSAYEGRHVAWSLDGTRILASGDGMEELSRNLRAAGIDPGRVVFDYIDPPDAVRL